MCQVLPLSTFLFHLILTTRRWRLHGPESEHASLTSPSFQPGQDPEQVSGVAAWGGRGSQTGRLA